MIMGLPLNNAYVKPHLAFTSVGRVWLCATAVLNPFYNRGDDCRRYMLVNQPVGVGTSPGDAYCDWARRVPRY